MIQFSAYGVIALLALAAALSAHAAPVASAPPPADLALVAATVEPAVVRIEGDTLVYRGNLSQASSRSWQRAVDGLPPGQLARIVIASGGGDTVEGRRLGRWVRQMNLVVEVDTICFSSCADYIFPAGRARRIRDGAIVGWHGNERSFEVQAARAGLSLKAHFLQRLGPEIANAPPEMRQGLSVEAFADQWLARLHSSSTDERAFFSALGLDDRFMVCGVGDALERRPDYRHQQGWGFSLTEMAKLGLADTVYLGEGAYEQTPRFRDLLILLTAQQCLDLMSTR
jgi:hypothetical protein